MLGWVTLCFLCVMQEGSKHCFRNIKDIIDHAEEVVVTEENGGRLGCMVASMARGIRDNPT